MLTKSVAEDGTEITSLSQGSDKKVELRCDSCQKTSITTYHNYCLSQEKKGNTGLTTCRSCSSSNIANKRRGTPAWNKGKRLPPEKLGINNPSWKGGAYIDKHGYRMVYVGGKKKSIGWTSYKKEHHLVVEEAESRKLRKGEVVHHIDGDKLLNTLYNLFVTDHEGHRKAHQSLQGIGYKLVQKGFILFDKKLGEYVADIKLRELLEHPEVGNQQPSQDSNILEGSTTRTEP